MLVTHQATGANGRFIAPYKRAVVVSDDAGNRTLRMLWFEGNDRLRGRPLNTGGNLSRLNFDLTRGVMIEENVELPAGDSGAASGTATAPVVGFALGVEAGFPGIAVVVDAQGRGMLGPVDAQGTVTPIRTVDRELQGRIDWQRAGGVPLLLLLRQRMLELYVDGHLLLVYGNLPAEHGFASRAVQVRTLIGTLSGSGSRRGLRNAATVLDAAAWEMALPSEPTPAPTPPPTPAPGS